MIEFMKLIDKDALVAEREKELMQYEVAFNEKQKPVEKQIYWTEEEIEPIISDYLCGREHYGGMIGRLRCLKPKQKPQRMVSAEAKEALYDKPVEHIIDDGKEEMDYCFTKMMLGEKVNDTDEDIVEAVKDTSILDMVEPKFKVGDWIVQKGLGIYKIVEICESWYEVISYKDGIQYSIGFDKENDCYLWTIQDAKDGDVLVGNEDGVILMFRGIGNTEWDDVIDYHCYYDCHREDLIIQEDVEYWGNIENNKLKPATKEQRNFLFQKIKEASYKWDTVKKKLKKQKNKSNKETIKPLKAYLEKQKPVEWSEEDEQFLLVCKNALAKYQTTDKWDANIISRWLENKLKSLNPNKKLVAKKEPKFKVGNWVVDSQGLTHQIERVVENVTTHTFGYDIVGGGYFNDDNEGAHLWTIQDAKDGDVLATDNDSICIFDGTVEEGKYPFAYCGLTRLGFESYDKTLPFTHNDVHPATKEQCDLLFQKMKELGYEWDAEKKELRVIDWSKHIKYGQNSPSITKENPAWSENDEIFVHGLIRGLSAKRDIHGHTTFGSDYLDITETIDWLRTLKDRLHPKWKPSEEQIDVLNMAVTDEAMDDNVKTILKELIIQIKKL